ncbi:ABC transporter ATP-binding protein [Paracoccus jeotgali]|uniref:ABC transporter ATP-binding protein n=1 Tax=Paracoccus jeotgali TaxID=2065379 RepID=A0A2K9MG91_9RHOB|nr:ATP-binding cassette domain-containing protein [Paracoccus jeotgali]AUM74630.1 ABC transporter ATP-binding protein [Paracoccus jeotgali]
MSDFLQIRDVSKSFGEVHALRNVTLDVHQGECLAVVGESGSGKSTLANILLGVFGPSGGSLHFRGAPLPARRTLEHRRAIQLVQQNPLSSLNPKRSVGASVRLGLDVYGIGSRRERDARVGQILEEVGLPAEYRRRSPTALSGGQRQRVAIARALACGADLIVLDEPTSALDVLVQARVLRLLNDLRPARGLTYLFITHDLSVVRNIADRVAVFKSGELVECASTDEIFLNPQRNYTRELIGAVPVVTQEEVALRDRLSKQDFP